MECTQRIDCTQELCQNSQERIFPEQIGFLGICGTKYPIRKGPNKIGRDPETCEIVLNLNSVSRQHAVINILNSKEFMIMDLGSANKTKLLEKTLQPYIAHPLRNGDTVQFGHVFGVFMLLEDENDLPMTQALDIPDTPVVNKHASKLFNFPSTVIPESPDVSDKDDSFVAPSQSKNYDFKSPSQNYIKSFGKTIAIQPIGSKQIDNIYWNSSKKSVSINMELNDSDTDLILKSAEVADNIHEMETQIPCHTGNGDSDDLYLANTQLVESSLSSGQVILKPNIETKCDMNVENKENNNSIYNADTQQLNNTERDVKCKTNSTENVSNDFVRISKARLSVSDEEIHFQELDMEPFDEDFASQPLLLPETVDGTEVLNLNGDESIGSNIKENKIVDGDNRCEGSTDCDDFNLLLTQRIPCAQSNTSISAECNNKKNITSNKNLGIDDDSTDCEDELFDNDNMDNKVLGPSNKSTLKTSETKLNSNIQDKDANNLNFEDMLTQVVEVVNDQNGDETVKSPKESRFEDLLTQVITVTDTEGLKQNEKCQEQSPFKVPFQSVKNNKRKEITNNTLNSSIKNISNTCENDDEKFYPATQDVFNDLCSQREISPGKLSSHTDTRDICSPNVVTPKKDDKFARNQSDEINVDELRKKQNRVSSGSDAESTPDSSRKNLTFMNTEPPNSQEIVNNLTFYSKRLVTESCSDSEDNVSEHNTPILFHKNKRIKKTKLDLTKKFELDNLPTRTITRKRKATAKVENNSVEIKNTFKNILAPKMFGEEDETVDKEIIAINISRIKNAKIEKDKKKSHQNDTTKSSQTQQDQTVKSNETNKAEINALRNNPEDSKDQNTTKSRTEAKPSIKEVKKYKSRKNESNNLGTTEQEQSPETSKSDTSRLRSTRTKRNDNKTKPAKEIIKVSIGKYKGKRTYEEEIHVESPEKEVRRNKRQKIKKETEVNTKKKHDRMKIQNDVPCETEKSIIYRLSGESSPSSPRSVKSFRCDVTLNTNKSEATSSVGRRSLRRTALKNHKVLFTAFAHRDINMVHNLLEKLNAVVVTDVHLCTVVVTTELRRTFKLLCAVGLGRPIVGRNWIQACRDANMIIDPWLYLMKDEVRESRFDFELARTLAGKRDFLKGYNISSTPNVEPRASEMKMIVECSGGTWKEGGQRWVCVSNVADKALWPALKRRGAILVNAEFILGGVLRQVADLERTRLT